MGTNAHAKKPWEASSQEQGKGVTTAFGSSIGSDLLKLSFNDTTFNVVQGLTEKSDPASGHSLLCCLPSALKAQAVMQLW